MPSLTLLTHEEIEKLKREGNLEGPVYHASLKIEAHYPAARWIRTLLADILQITRFNTTTPFLQYEEKIEQLAKEQGCNAVESTLRFFELHFRGYHLTLSGYADFYKIHDTQPESSQ